MPLILSTYHFSQLYLWMLELDRHSKRLRAKTSVFILRLLKINPLFQENGRMTRFPTIVSYGGACAGLKKRKNDEHRDKKTQREQVTEVTAVTVNLLVGQEREIRQGHDHRSM